MLNLLRRKKITKFIIWATAIIIIPAFVFWGAGNMSKKRIGGFTYVGFIGGRKISIDEFYKTRKGVQLQILLKYFDQKETMDEMMKDRMLLNRLTWERIIMLDEAKKENIKIGDNEVVNFITAEPLFIHNGKFDEKFYNYMLY